MKRKQINVPSSTPLGITSDAGSMTAGSAPSISTTKARVLVYILGLATAGILYFVTRGKGNRSNGSRSGQPMPTPTSPRTLQPAVPRSATRAEIIALLERYEKEFRSGGGHATPVGRSHSAPGRKRAVMFPDLTPEVRDAFVIFLYEEVGLSHREISHIVALSPRAIAHRLHAVGIVRYVEKTVSSRNRNNPNQ